MVSFRFCFSLFIFHDNTQASFFHTTLFVDGRCLQTSNFCFSVRQTTVNLGRCKIDHWLVANKLTFNYNNTNFTVI